MCNKIYNRIYNINAQEFWDGTGEDIPNNFVEEGEEYIGIIGLNSDTMRLSENGEGTV